MQQLDQEPENIRVVIDPDLKMSFKVKCAQEKTTMTDVIIAAIQNFVNGKARRRSA